MGVHVRETKKKKRKVEKGLRRQQLAWEPRGHGGGIDFINRASQHSGSGCSGGAPTGDRKETRREDETRLRRFTPTETPERRAADRSDLQPV